MKPIILHFKNNLKHVSVGQNRNIRNKLNMQPNDLQQNYKNTQQRKDVLSKNDIGNTRYPNTASPSLSLDHITHKTDQT